MVDLDEFQLAKLAREMAMNIRSYQKVFEDFGIDENDYYEIEKIEFYKRAKEQFALEWNSVLTTPDRVKLLSAVAAEQGTLALGKRMLKEHEPLAAAVDVFKTISKNAGLGEPKAAGPDAGRFVITINLSGETETYDKSIAVDAKDVSPSKVITAGDSDGQTDDETAKEVALDRIRAAREG